MAQEYIQPVTTRMDSRAASEDEENNNNLSTTILMPKPIFTHVELEEEIMKNINNIINDGIKITKPGSINYLLFGPKPSMQSVCIKMGKIGEKIPIKIIENSSNLELLKCGVQCIDTKTNKNKDLDLVWKDEENKTIYYREAKGNLDLDSEKLPATIQKIEEILNIYIKNKYPGYTIDIGIFNWSIYNRRNIKNNDSHIKKCEEKGIKVEHMEDMLKLLKFEWSEDNFNQFFRKAGKFIDEMF